jgi:hypothetical protein
MGCVLPLVAISHMYDEPHPSLYFRLCWLGDNDSFVPVYVQYDALVRLDPHVLRLLLLYPDPNAEHNVD